LRPTEEVETPTGRPEQCPRFGWNENQRGKKQVPHRGGKRWKDVGKNGYTPLVGPPAKQKKKKTGTGKISCFHTHGGKARKVAGRVLGLSRLSLRQTQNPGPIEVHLKTEPVEKPR